MRYLKLMPVEREKMTIFSVGVVLGKRIFLVAESKI
jgi:hypothetical protein